MAFVRGFTWPGSSTGSTAVDCHIVAWLTANQGTEALFWLLSFPLRPIAERHSGTSDMNQNRRRWIQSTVIRTILALVSATALSVSSFAEDLDEGIQQAVLVELFTSQGCSSCPPADANLKRLAMLAKERNFPIYTLSFHVDYWNHLGWKDPFSSSPATNRQRMYSRRFKLGRIYTPQFVVNGQWEFVGSNRTHTRAAILKALQTSSTAKLTATAKLVSGKITVDVTASQFTDGDQLMIALVQNQAASEVDRGENSGRSLQHIHVVRDFKVVDAHQTVSVDFLKPDSLNPSEFHVLAYLQSGRDLSLQAVSKTELSGEEYSSEN